ncbi:MAG: HAMP domain-containing histidine kinase [Solobacterium sp.]|nr:HAMP domain-containing histidine kinase [Solobacterium sp.]
MKERNKKRLRSSYLCKVIAFILFALAATADIVGMNAISYLSTAGAYDGISKYSDTADARARAAVTANNYVLYALDINTNFVGDQYKSFDRENSNLSVEIYEVATNQLIHKNFDVEESTLHGTAYFYGNNSDGYFQDYIEKNNEPTYRIEYSLAKDLNARDDFYYCDTVYNLQYRFRYIIFPIEFFSIIILIGSVIFLFYGAGHVDDKPCITLSWIDKIPLDIFAFIVLMVWTYASFYTYNNGFPDIAINFYQQGYYYGFAKASIIKYIMVIVGGVIPFLHFTLLFFLSLATRIKYGNWYKNTLIYYIGTIISDLLQIGGYFPAFLLGSFVFWVAFYFLVQLQLYVLLGLFLFIASYALFWRAYEAALLKKAIHKFANGETDFSFHTSRLSHFFKIQALDLYKIKDFAEAAAKKSIRAEHLQNELITNVSHDIKTPLTSIINYVHLLQHVEDPEQAKKYIAVLEKQSKRLQKLTEDLIEASKASTGNIMVNIMPNDLHELLEQAVGEYSDRFDACKLEIVTSIPESARSVMADGRLLWRVFSNLFSNLVKYAQPETRVYINSVRTIDNNIMISIKNVSREALNISAEELTQRFVRGDESRHSEGSGLGLNIVENLVHLQNGYFNIVIDGDLFRTNIILPAKPEEVPTQDSSTESNVFDKN